MFLYFTCWPENVRFSLQMTWKCLKYILSLRQKIRIGLFFQCVFLGKVTCNCKYENTFFPAQKMLNFKMWGKNQTKTPKNSPKPECVHLGTVWCQFCAKAWPKLNLDISARGLRVLQVTWNETVENCVNTADFVYNYSKQFSQNKPLCWQNCLLEHRVLVWFHSSVKVDFYL